MKERKLTVFMVTLLVVAFMFSGGVVYAETSAIGNKVNGPDIMEGELQVVIKHEYSIIGKTFTAEDFPELEIEGIVNLYPGSYEPTLYVYLKEHTKQAVWDAITELENNEYVKDARAMEVIPIEPAISNAVTYENGLLGVSVLVGEDKFRDSEEIVLNGNVITEGEELELLTNNLDGEAYIVEMFFVDNDSEIVPQRDIEIHFNIPDNINGKECIIYRIETDNSLTELETRYRYDISNYHFWQKRVAVTQSLGKFLIVGKGMTNPWELEYEIQDGVLKKYLGYSQFVTVPSEFSEIGEKTFEGKTGILSVTLPNNITKIGDNAFSNMGDGFYLEAETLTYAEVYATEKGIEFKPTNNQRLGDINGNRIYEAEDALSILKMVVELEPVYGYSADANEDGDVTAKDALYVLKKVVKLI